MGAKGDSMAGRGRKGLFAVVTLLVAVALVELVAFFAALFLEQKAVFYGARPSASYLEYVEARDPVLGWPARSGKKATDDRAAPGRDASGSRWTPSFPDPEADPARISLYGDSFTWSDEVSSENAWGNVLSELLGERVANYGVGGYGSDQALLRYIENEDDGATIVFLNHFSENILRNVNRFRPLLSPYAEALGWKPRFILTPGGEIAHLPLPTFSEAEYEVVVADPATHLEHEYFVPGGPSGVQEFGFPLSPRVLASLRHFQFQARFRGVPYYADFYESSHPSQSLAVTAGILERFVHEARKRGQIPLPSIIPSDRSLLYFQETGQWTYQPLLDALERSQIEVLNFGPGILERLGPEGVEAILSPWADISTNGAIGFSRRSRAITSTRRAWYFPSLPSDGIRHIETFFESGYRMFRYGPAG